ncbi:putative xylanase 35 [Xylariaceae sp. FL0016]|nr:putative xylanase 35 [Xylariaceae sp. FL0016]
MAHDPPQNPIIPGFSPDPSICLVGNTFFLVNSSFHIFPGLPIYASRDLVSWRHIGNAIDRPSQISLRKATTYLNNWEDGSVMLATGGLYAPTIRHHGGRTYIVNTNIVHHGANLKDGEHAENFIIWTDDIWAGNWSDPMYYDFDGIDPSFYFENGKAYIQGSKTPEFKIYNLEIDVNTGKILDGPKLIWEGWDQRYTEGPHIIKKDGWYYLLCAEGGTFEFHMISMARSKNIWGPYEACTRNPVWTAYGTENYIQHTGHSDIVQGPEGAWWIVMLGVRKRAGRYTMGRETFLSSIEWKLDDWPQMKPISTKVDGLSERPTGQVIQTDEGLDWIYVRDPNFSLFHITGNGVSIQATKPDLSSPSDTLSFIGKRQRLLEGSSIVSLSLECAKGKDVKAGLALFKDEHRYVELFWDFSSQKIVIHGLNTAKSFSINKSEDLHGSSEKVWFQINYTEIQYEFSIAQSAEGPWQSLGSVDTLALTGFDFIGPMVGIFAIGEDSTIKFEEFRVDV